jgi:glyoxylase-like metal-dependent hydrolase (beta-lactamase superfamily II)
MHSAGSLGLYVKDAGGSSGDLFCGDVLINMKGPAIARWRPGPDTVEATMERLRALSIQTVYPGHGEPFRFGEL